MDGGIDRWMDGGIDRWMNGVIDRWMDGWMDEWMVGSSFIFHLIQKTKNIKLFFLLFTNVW